MENPNERFADPGISTHELATHFVVHCPKCDSKAHVGPAPQHRLLCTKCFHNEMPGHWYGAVTAYVSVKCRECHAPIRHSAPWNGQWKKLGTICGECGDKCEYEAQITRHPVSNGLITDRIFGLPLWLQRSFRDEILWAYNYEHLDMIRQYVSAKLRERGITPLNKISKNRSMLARLPQFIKKAGNREALLRCISEMEGK